EKFNGRTVSLGRYNRDTARYEVLKGKIHADRCNHGTVGTTEIKRDEVVHMFFEDTSRPKLSELQASVKERGFREHKTQYDVEPLDGRNVVLIRAREGRFEAVEGVLRRVPNYALYNVGRQEFNTNSDRFAGMYVK